MSPNRLLKALMKDAPFQPATNYWRAVEIAAVLDRGLPIGRGLDLGCGDGKLTKTMLDASTAKDRQMIGIDLDPLETNLAIESKIYQHVHTCSATAIPEEDESFDFVFSNSVLEHIGPIEGVLDEVARLLKPNGKFLFTVPSSDFHRCLKGGQSTPSARSSYLEEIDKRCAHLRYWSEAQWRSQLAQRSIKVDFVQNYLSEKQVRRWEVLSAMTGGLLYKLHGKKSRPIEIQRALKMRSGRNGVLGSVGSLCSPLLAIGADLEVASQSDHYGCVMIEAVKIRA